MRWILPMLFASLLSACDQPPASGSAAPAATTADTDWALHGNDYANTRFSALTQITAANVKQLKLAWKINTGKSGAFQTAPVMVDGTLYITTPYNDVLALDAASGAQRWRYQHQLTQTEFCCGPANRGAAVANGVVYMATIDNRLIALNAATGQLRWDTAITNPSDSAREVFASLIGEAAFKEATVTGGTGYTASMAPQVFDGKVFVGIAGVGYGLHLDLKDREGGSLSVVGLSGGQHGLRGFIAAYDAATGSELWRWYSVPDANEADWRGEFRDTTPDGVPLNRDIAAERARSAQWAESWRLGGGSIWTTPAIDPERRLMFFGTGNPAPQMDDFSRPGDNLYTSSLVALNLDTGKRVWSYQQVPHDRWGYDAASPPILLDVDHLGKKIAAVAQASKTGWVYFHNRDNGELLFKSEAFVPQRNLFARPTAEGVEIAPAILGGAQWSPLAANPHTQTYFLEGVHRPARYFTKPLTPTAESPWQSYTYMELHQSESWGVLAAVDANNGKIKWQQQTAQPMVGGLLATASGLLFAGEGNGNFNAYDAAGGSVLWSHRADAGVNAPPMTYAVAGKQYIAVAAGGNGIFDFPLGDTLLVFALE